LDLEDEAWQADNLEGLFQMTADDFLEEKPCTSDEQKLIDAAELITKNHITDRTQTGHLQFISKKKNSWDDFHFNLQILSSPRNIRAFVKFMLDKNPKWVAEVTPQSLQDV